MRPVGAIAGGLTLREKERIERGFWPEHGRPRDDRATIHNILAKANEARGFLAALQPFEGLFMGGGLAVELGGGQGWSAALVKRLHPQLRVVATDIGGAVLTNAPLWERIYGAHLDGRVACKSYELPFTDGSIDLLWAYEAAHHFVRQRATLREIERVLRPGGVALYLREPTCGRWIYPLAKARVVRKRPSIPEDVLIWPEMSRLAREAGLDPEIHLDTNPAARQPIETVYYLVLRTLPRLRYWLPCALHLVLRKPCHGR